MPILCYSTSGVYVQLLQTTLKVRILYCKITVDQLEKSNS